jgi:hypothetical protein
LPIPNSAYPRFVENSKPSACRCGFCTTSHGFTATGTAQSLNFSFTGEAVDGAASGSASIFSALCSTTSVSFVTLMVWFSSSAAAKGVKAAEARIMLYNAFVFITISVL